MFKLTVKTSIRTAAAAFLALAMLATTGIASAQYNQGPPPPPPGQGDWNAPPPQFAAAERRGYHDGVEGARKDFDHHRAPDVNNRNEYRNPHFIAPPDRESYRHGFREGYRVAVQHIYNGR